MIVTNLTGETELLADYTSLKRTRKVNGDYSLSFVILKTEKNQHAYPLVEEESIVEYDGQQYRIKDVTEVLAGITPIKTVQASHIFFDLVDTYKYDYLWNTQNIQACLNFALAGTGYTFEIIDSFPSSVFEKFGEDNSLSLVQKALNVFGAEVQINNKHLKFYRQIGTDTDTQIRYNYNVKTLEKYVNTNNLSTRIRGFGKKDENENYIVTAEYISPNAAIYGIRDANPIYDERYTIYEELLERIKSEIIDEPQVSFKVDALELKKIGVLTEQLSEGDRVFVIYEPLGIDLMSRVLEIVDYPESSNPAEYTFGNFKNNFVSEMAGFQKTKDSVDAILNGEQKLPYSALDDAVLRATEALSSAMTELIFKDGIIARDPSNPNRLVLINSKGIGISDNGGVSFKEAITADGFVLSAGVIGSLKANNIDVDSLSAISAILGEVTAGTVKSSTFRTSDSAPYALIKDDSSLVLASSDNDAAQGGDVGIRIDPNDFHGNPTINFISSYYHSQDGEFKGSQGNGRIALVGNPSDPNYKPSLSLYAEGSIELVSDVEKGEPGVVIRTEGITRVNGDFLAGGSKNCVVKTSIGEVKINAYETAGYYFGDIGRGQVVEGQCVVEIESLFKETVNTNIDYEVFLTPYGSGVIYVDPDEMTTDHFIVRGDDIKFGYEIKAKRLGYEDVRLETV